MELSPEQVQSVNVLLSAVQVAQRRGAFSLQDAHALQAAIDKLVPREEQERQAAEAAEVDDHLTSDDATSGIGPESSVSLADDTHVHDENCGHDVDMPTDATAE
jgi:hypothetical protein